MYHYNYIVINLFSNPFLTSSFTILFFSYYFNSHYLGEKLLNIIIITVSALSKK